MEIDTKRVDEAVLALLYLGLRDDKQFHIAQVAGDAPCSAF
jgi:hypothetical protein